MGILFSFSANGVAKAGRPPLRGGDNEVWASGLVEALQYENLKSKGVTMRKRLKKKRMKWAKKKYKELIGELNRLAGAVTWI